MKDNDLHKNFIKNRIIFSSSIIVFFLTIGTILSVLILNSIDKQNRQIESTFTILTSDNIHSALSDTAKKKVLFYGTMESDNLVSMDKITNKIRIIRLHEKKIYNSTSTNNMTNQLNYSWKTVRKDIVSSKKLSFCGMEFNGDIFPMGDALYIKTKNINYKERYIYYTIEPHKEGTVFAYMCNNSMSECRFYKNMNEKQVLTDFFYTSKKFAMFRLWFFLSIIVFCITILLFFITDEKTTVAT